MNFILISPDLYVHGIQNIMSKYLLSKTIYMHSYWSVLFEKLLIIIKLLFYSECQTQFTFKIALTKFSLANFWHFTEIITHSAILHRLLAEVFAIDFGDKKKLFVGVLKKYTTKDWLFYILTVNHQSPTLKESRFMPLPIKFYRGKINVGNLNQMFKV